MAFDKQNYKELQNDEQNQRDAKLLTRDKYQNRRLKLLMLEHS